MSVRQILPYVGAAIGGYFGGPSGAQWGWAIGSAVGNAVDPELIKGPSIGDIAAQTSQEGIPRPFFFALSQPIAGNIIAADEPQVVAKYEREGKGGPKVRTESVFRTYAIGVGEGPITRFVRVWRNGTLVYDAESAHFNTEHDFDFLGASVTIPTANNAWLSKARFFLGAWDQEPSADLETVFGMGTTPAHRGTAYMVMADEDLTDLRGAIPQYQFQVERCEGFYLTSHPYPIEASDQLDAEHELGSAPHPLWKESIDAGATVLAGTLGGILHVYDDYPPESIDSAHTLTEGELHEALHVYDDYPPESIDSAHTLTEGEVRVALLAYDNYPAESLDSSHTVLSGSLS